MLMESQTQRVAVLCSRNVALRRDTYSGEHPALKSGIDLNLLLRDNLHLTTSMHKAIAQISAEIVNPTNIK